VDISVTELIVLSWEARLSTGRNCQWLRGTIKNGISLKPDIRASALVQKECEFMKSLIEAFPLGENCYAITWPWFWDTAHLTP
jgi:hypothetical protein